MEDPIAAGLRVSAGSFGLGGTFGTQVWIDPKEKLVMILMIRARLQIIHCGAISKMP